MENEPTPAPSQSELVELRRDYDSLRHLVIAMLLLLIVVSGTLCIYMKRQQKTTAADLEVVRMQWTNAMVQYQRTEPVIEQAVKRFQEFARTNPDFAPIMAKYSRPGVTNTAAATQTSAPAATKK